MNALVIIPCAKPQYTIGFSAPLCWLFSKHVDQVKGVFHFELTDELILSFDFFILELNWFTELYEFTIIVNRIKSVNKEAKIMFGGLYAMLTHKLIFEKYDVDYFIKGDSELPMQMLLEDVPPRDIPNFVGRDFENSISYIFKQEDYANIEFSLDWFGSYQKYLNLQDELTNEERLYRNPMIVTTKGGCTVAHSGCDFCMGAKPDVLGNIYHREPLAMTHDSLIGLLTKLEKKFDKYSIYVNSEFDYDFSNSKLNSDVVIEVDSKINYKQIKDTLFAFRKCILIIPLYEDGLMGKKILADCNEILKLQDDNHIINFLTSQSEYPNLIKKIPKENLMCVVDTVYAAKWAHFDVYSNFDEAMRFSRVYYKTNKNLFHTKYK